MIAPQGPRSVLYLSPNSKLGGAEQMTFLLAKHHSRDRWQPLFYFLSDGPLVEQVRAAGIRVRIHPGPRVRLSRPWTVLDAVSDVATWARSERVSLIHSVMSYGHVIGGPAAVRAGVPETWFQHGPTGRLDWVAGAIPTGALFTNSKYTLGQELRYRPRARSLPVVGCAVEDALSSGLATEAEALRGEWGFDRSHVVFGLFARISSIKGHALLLEAAERLTNGFPSARFVLAGAPFLAADESYEREIRALAERPALRGRVLFTGFIAHPQYAALRACDAIVNASLVPEGFGLTLAEGMLLERAVIGPRSGGPAELIENGVDGLLFEPGDARSLESALLRLRDPAERARLGAAGRAKAVGRYAIRPFVDRIEREYEALLSPGARA